MNSNKTNDNGAIATIANAETSSWSHLEDDDDDLLLVNDDLNLNTSFLRSDERYMGFDNNVGDTWIYPSNFSERAYQYNIVQKALFHNTLVVLPTGLGKTFIAAVVMYNMYRWYPMGKVIFMAPTRPLVAQQIDACCKIMGIPKTDSVEITGKLNKSSRAQLWQSKRVFFATPQSVLSDIMDAELNFPFQAVKLIVVDEAHRAKGRYAYTDVISCIWSKNKYFRILALSATPGRRKEDVQEIIGNLFISALEIRTEDSVDVVSYVHKRQMKTVVVELGEKLKDIRNQLLAIADPHIRNLIDNRLVSGRPGSISRNWLVMEHKRFRESLQSNCRVPFQKELCSDFSICISVYHAIELLERHGLRVFLNNFDETQNGGSKFVVLLRPDLRRLIERVREDVGPNPFAFSDKCMVNGEIAAIPTNVDFGHPKFEIARDHVLAHFENNKNARVIIFCEYRESVMLMHRLLLQHRPLIRPRVFVGQGGTGSIRAVTQQQQIRVMNDFRSGESNALIATSVAEEGIDVGEVDLIVCFDINTTNPTRFIQRIGRTGRKKEGKVLLLATEGKEHTVLKEVLSERNKLNKSISRGGEFASIFYKQAPRMVPTEFNPKCMKTFIQPTLDDPKSKGKRYTSKSQQMPRIEQKRDLRHFFRQKIILDDEEKCIFEDSVRPNSPKPNISTLKVTTTLDENVETIHFSPPKLVEISSKRVKKIVKYLKNGLKVQTVDSQKTLTCNKLSKEGLQFLVDFSPDVVRNVWTHMQELWKKGINENKLPLKGITADDRQAVRAYFQLKHIFGSKENIALVVESRTKIPKVNYFSNLNEKYGFIFGNIRHNEIGSDNFMFLMEKFEKMAQLYPYNERSKESFIHSTVYDDEIDESCGAVNSFNKTNRDYTKDCILDSKYMSQWEEQFNDSSSDNIYPVCELPQPSISPRISDLNDSNIAMQVVPSNNTDENGDDEVVFVSVLQQSTPIRKGFSKQTLINFNETPIVNTLLNRPPKRQLATKRSQQNCLNFMKTSKEKTNSITDHPTGNDSKEFNSKAQSKSPVPLAKDHMDFFDDQFDAIIAENSGIIAQIENSTAINQINKNYNTNFENRPSQQALNDSISKGDIRNVVIDQSVSKISSDITTDPIPDGTVPLVNVTNATPSRRTWLGTNDSSPDGIVDVNSKSQPNFFDCPSQNTLENKLRRRVHPELKDMDFNNFSESFSNDGSEKLIEQKLSPRASPDIFEELSEPMLVSKVKEKSPLKQLGISPPTQVSPCILTKKALTWREVRLKYGKQSQTEPTTQPDDSVIHVASNIRPKRRIIDTDSDSSNNSRKIQKFVRRPFKKARLPRQRTSDFIDQEAAVSGSATEDESENTMACYMLDSVVVNDDDVENDLANMTEVYLQSVRSPNGNSRGAFKIPVHRQYNDASKIFSQKIPEDGSYMNDSFVVSDEGSDIDQSICPLERAEEILKVRRRAKRNAKMISDGLKQPAKRKRILRIHNSSEDDDDFN